ncbi:MAG: tRNA 4-thiouridine(8) synthase ThiI [Nitrososphaeria archaeon]|nr:tRNA 4-thiouridine(8) synthase ThiI [Nitrososphaeria archaeon]NIN52441.1 tRNA 4-thiouridine(8) synthase ThiI [Nitrososphaeria archaeon]NIQ32942.1 tRNA 4-thiouridine(8) synthase ThiI [Nitrososphaeria archaeon]
MEREGVLIAFSEIGLRTKRVRRRLLRLLTKNIEYALKWKGLKYNELSTSWNRILVYTKENNAAELLSHIPGVRFTAYCHIIPGEPDVDKLSYLVAERLAPQLEGKTFKVETHRRKKDLPYESLQISSLIGRRILEECGRRGITTKVKMTRPDIRAFVEVDKEHSLFYSKRYEGEGGYPIGAQGPMVSLFSGGTDSAVASWLVMTRGVRIYPLFIDQSPFVGCCNLVKAVDVLLALRDFVLYPNLNLAVSKVGKIMEKIVERANKRYICVLCKRLMYKVATHYARGVEAKGIVTGESIGQVASQTVDNLYVLSQATHLPLYRPLAGFSKERIHEIAKRIDVYKTAAVDMGYCDILPNKPATRSDLATIEGEEEKIDIEEDIKQAVMKIEMIKL